MKYVLAAFSLVVFMGCSSSRKADNGLIQLQAPVITDQEFEDGVPAPGAGYNADVPYQTQLQQSGGTYIKSTSKKTTKKAAKKTTNKTKTTTTTKTASN